MGSLGAMVSVTDVEVTPDLSLARIFVSVLAPDDARDRALEALAPDGIVDVFAVAGQRRLEVGALEQFRMDDLAEPLLPARLLAAQELQQGVLAGIEHPLDLVDPLLALDQPPSAQREGAVGLLAAAALPFLAAGMVLVSVNLVMMNFSANYYGAVDREGFAGGLRSADPPYE